MSEEKQIRAALKLEANQVHLPSDLLDRIERQATLRPTLRRRLRLGPLVEIGAVCLLVFALVGVGLVRQLHQPPAPGDGRTDPPAQTALRGDATDGTIWAATRIERQADQWQIHLTVQNLSANPIELKYGCDTMVVIDGLESLVVRSCPPRIEGVVVGPGETKQAEITLKAGASDNPKFATVAYMVKASGPIATPLRTLNIRLQSGPRTIQDASDLVVALRAAGLSAQATGELSIHLFGATRVDGITVEGRHANLYSFESSAAADQAWATMTNPAAHTVSWAYPPEFVRMGALILQIDASDPVLVRRVKGALLDQIDHQPLALALPSFDAVQSAYLPGGPKMPEWRLTPEGVQKVIGMLEQAELITPDAVLPPPPSGPSQPLELHLVLKSGETIRIQRDADCLSTSDLEGGITLTTCTESKERVSLAWQGGVALLRAPALASWFAGEWQRDVLR
jgi:hypothetical protein